MRKNIKNVEGRTWAYSHFVSPRRVSTAPAASHTPPICCIPAALPAFAEIAADEHRDPRAVFYTIRFMDPQRSRPFTLDVLDASDFGSKAEVPARSGPTWLRAERGRRADAFRALHEGRHEGASAQARPFGRRHQGAAGRPASGRRLPYQPQPQTVGVDRLRVPR